MIRLASLLLAANLLAHAGWEEYRTGPFEVWTEGSEKEGRQLLVRLEQMRHTLGTYLGKADPVSLWTIRVLIRKNAPPAAWTLGRDAWISSLTAGTPPTRQWLREVSKMLLESNARRMPAEWENGLEDFLSTIESQGPKVTLGTPPEIKNKDWARVHFLATNPEYGSRFRVLLNNLQQGALEEVAFRNSIGMTRPQLEAEITKYMAAGTFTPLVTSGRALSERDFPARPIEPPRANAALADVSGNYKLTVGGGLEATESAGLDAARNNRTKDALVSLQQAIADGSNSAIVHYEYAKLLTDPEAKRKALVEAAKRNGRWTLPYVEMAKLETDPARMAHYLKEAATRDLRNSEIWQQLGRAQLEAGQFSEASKSFYTAQLAAPTPEAREQIDRLRRQFEEDRAEREAAERKRIADERQRELDNLKTEAMNRVKEAEAKANKGQQPLAPGQKVEDWWDDKQPTQKITGLFERVDCLKGPARIWVHPANAKAMPLLIRDPAQIVIMGGGEAALGCGIQKPAKQATVEYRPRQDAKMATQGDVTLIEFR